MSGISIIPRIAPESAAIAGTVSVALLYSLTGITVVLSPEPSASEVMAAENSFPLLPDTISSALSAKIPVQE